MIADFGLGIALEGFCEEFGKAQGIQVKFEGLIEDSQLDPAGATCLYRIAQESMRNAVIHGRATEICVDIWQRTTGLYYVSAITPMGFGAQEPGPKTGLGVVSMRELVGFGTARSPFV